MAGTPWGSIISAIAGHIDNTKTNLTNLGSNLMTNLFNYKMNERNNALQQRLADQANQWQIEQRDYENWYNSPAGLQSRGLNPALAMANGGAALAGSNSAGEAHVADTQAFRASQPVFQSDANSALAAAQIANLDSVTDLNNAEVALKEQELPVKEQQYLNMKQEFQNLLKENQRISSEIRKLDASAQKDIAEAVNIPKMFDLKSKEVDATIDSLKADARYKNILGNLTNREIWERCMTWTLRLNGLDLANQEIASRVGFNNAMTNTEWFKQQDYNSQIMYRGTLNAKTYTEFYLEALGVPEAEIKSNYFKADYDVQMSSRFTRFVSYLNHVFGKAVSPVLSRFNLGVNYSFGSKTINSIRTR